MHLTGLGLLSLGAATVNAFQNTSPFFLASTSEILDKSSSSSQIQIQTATWLLDEVYSKLASCPSDYYVIASQPGVHSADFSSSKSAPRLGAKMLKEASGIRSSLTVNEVADVVDAKQIRDMIVKTCGAGNTAVDASTGSYPNSFGDSPRVVTVDFPMLSLGSDRAQQLQDNDDFLAHIIDRIASPKYTLLYVTSPREYLASDSAAHHPSDENAYQDPVHMDLKRDYSSHIRRGDSTAPKSLFQKYQYLTPGLFMGLLVTFFCLLILYVGLSALTSLQVPYAAFEKDTSASVQKKQQ